MSKSSWTWAAAASATLAGVAAAMLVSGATPARSEDGDVGEVHTPPSDFGDLITALENWDTDGAREDALAAYLGEESGAALLAPFEDATYLDNH